MPQIAGGFGFAKPFIRMDSTLWKSVNGEFVILLWHSLASTPKADVGISI